MPLRRKLKDNEVDDLIKAGQSPRYTELDRYQAFYEGTAYKGRASYYDRDSGIPRLNRAPCIVYPSIRSAVESNVAFAMGEGRFPKILSMASEDDSVFDPRFGLNPADSAVVDSFNQRLLELGCLGATFRQSCKMAQAAKSSVHVLSYRNGLPVVDLVWSKLCTPTFDVTDPEAVTSLEIRYRYTETFKAPDNSGDWWTVVKEYLRIIDAKNDTTFIPVEIWEKSDPGPQTKDPARTVAHGFGVCPVVWYRHAPESTMAGSVDGKALAEGMLTSVEGYDHLLSGRHMAALYSGDPQWALSGVDPEDPIGKRGSTMTSMPGEANTQWSKAMTVGQNNGGKALVKGPGEIWCSANADAKFDLVTLPGDALVSMDNTLRDELQKICDGLGVTLLDTSTMTGAGDMSGRTLSFIFSRQINKVSQLREDFGRRCILRVLNMFYRMFLANSAGLYLPGLAKVLPILARFQQAVGTTSKLQWFPPQLKLDWGAYFEPSDVDEATRLDVAVKAYAAGLVTLQSAVEHVRGVFVIASVADYLKALTAEKVQKQADAVANAGALAAATAPPGGPTKPGSQSAAPGGTTSAAPPAKPPQGKQSTPTTKAA